MILAAVIALALAALVRLPSSDATPAPRARGPKALLPLEAALTTLKDAWKPEDHKRVLDELAQEADKWAALPDLLDQPDHPLIVPGIELAAALKLEDALPKVLALAERKELRIPALSAADAIAPLPEGELVALLDDAEPEMVLAALAMARRREPPLLRALVNLLDHANEKLAAGALATLPQRLPEELRRELEALTHDERAEVRTRAYQALLRIDQEPADGPEKNVELLAGPDLRKVVDSYIGPEDEPDTHASLVAQLESRDEAARVAALEGLCVLARPQDAERVAALLQDSNSVALQKQACLFLGRVQHRPAVRDLIDLLRDAPDPGLKANALWSLQRTTGLQLNRDPELWELWWKRSGGDYASSPR